jgi:hypothetical protein
VRTELLTSRRQRVAVAATEGPTGGTARQAKAGEAVHMMAFGPGAVAATVCGAPAGSRRTLTMMRRRGGCSWR